MKEASYRKAMRQAIRDYLAKRGRAANKARNAKLSAAKRKQIAAKAAKKRWAGRMRRAL
jgi:hypothetical protein